MVKQGYKQTEIGLIPNDWNIVSIEKLAADMSDGPFGSNLKKEHYTDDKQARIIQLSNIGENGWLDTNVKYTTFSHAKTISRCIVNPGHIIVAKMMPAGRAIICPSMEKMYVLGSDSIKLELNATLVNTKYFMYSTKSSFFQTQIKEETQGSTRARTSISKLRKNKVLLPSIEEQKRIAEALSEVDSMISSLEKLIAKKKAVKQGAMQELLTGKKRLLGFTDEWKIKTLKEISHEIVDGPFGSDLKKEHYTTDPQVRIIQLSNIGESGWNDENTKYTTFAHAYELSRCIVQPQAVLIAKMMPAGRAILCPNNEKGYIIGSDVVKLIPNDDIDRKYLIYATKSQFYLNQIADDTQGSTRSRTSVSKLRKTSILFPSKQEQTAIASVLSDMDNEIEALEQKLEKTRQVKQGMMQQLLTGKIRLV